MVLTRRLECGLDKVGLGEVEVDSGGRVDEEGIERLAGPLLRRSANAPHWGNVPDAAEALTWMVCSIALGKFFTVQDGIDFSGGSCEDEYDSVTNGTTTWVLALVPRVPDSRRGFW